jgi:hypothetical protein
MYDELMLTGVENGRKTVVRDRIAGVVKRTAATRVADLTARENMIELRNRGRGCEGIK